MSFRLRNSIAEVVILALISQEKILQALDWAYEKSVNGVPGMGTAEEMALDYMRSPGSELEQVNSLIRWQISKASASGFLTGLGGVVTLPASIPANIVSVLYVQVRMISAIAYIGGYDIRDDRVKTLVYLCLVSNSAKDFVKDVGVAVGAKFATNAIKSISGKTIQEINKKVGFRLVTKFGEKGVLNIGKMVPLLGGVIGGLVDGVVTNSIGNVARDAFIVSGIE